MSRILGIDLSLTGTGMAWLDTDGVQTKLVTSESVGKDGTLDDWYARLIGIKNEVLEVGQHCDLAVIEGPSYNSKNGAQHERAGLWWMVVGELLDWGVPVGVSSPLTIKKYATGSGSSRVTKDQVLTAVVRRYYWVDVDNNNVADAMVLLAMGCRAINIPIDEPMPKVNKTAVDAVKWSV